MRDELKPCPFCGERPRLTLRPDNAEGTAYFAAVACYCGGYSACAHKMATATNADEAEGKVRAAWNRRAAAQPPAAMPAPTGWICRHKQQVADAEEAFPGQPHDYLWKYTHGTRDMAECEGYGDFDVVRLYATPQAQSVPATGAQPEFDHSIGEDRYTVTKSAFWWHVRIGDSTANAGKFYTRHDAEDMALKLLTAFRDGAFSQRRADLAAPTGSAG